MTTSPSVAVDGPAGMKRLNILMLHGYTQSGPQFHAKTKALEKFLVKALASSSIVPSLIYPTAPNRLLFSNLPEGTQTYIKKETEAAGADAQEAQEGDHWAWFRKDDATNTYLFLEEGMNAVAKAIDDAGGIHGVCGFSQGGAMTGLVAAALEPSRPVPDESTPEGRWVRKLRLANRGRPVLFGVNYSGFWAPVENLQFLYEPKLRTPLMHYIGSLDTLVDESRSRALADRCETSVVVVHPGGHFVPIARNWAEPVAAFVAQHASAKAETLAAASL